VTVAVLLREAVPLDVVDDAREVVVASPMENVGVEAKTSLMLPMLTASMV